MMKRLNSKGVILITTIIIALLVIVIDNADDDFQMEHPDTSGINQNIKIERFHKDLTAHIPADSNDIAMLKEKYGAYFDAFCQYEIEVGSPDSAQIIRNLNGFLHWEELPSVLQTVDSVFTEDVFNDIESRLSDAFACMKVLIPSINEPHIASHCSGFNSNILVDSTYISFSVEHYLGSDCRYYEWLQTPMYSRRAKSTEYIAADIIKCWLYANFPDVSSQHDVINAMIYQGKILYAARRLMPTEPLKHIFGYNDADMQWCKDNEKLIWTGLVDKKLLYDNSPMDINKLVRDAPFTAQFGQNVPGRAALFCAFRIVCNYMENNPTTILADLLNEPDAQKILMGAKYTP
ncbi:MAG: hypothetical protein J6Y72_07180 [Bacteroidales bacterium]|nr:hypothetical protein [Bacteroidales bacterium]